ncbi:MAG: type III pantothenate kinase [Saprospiraceae bacterium]|nr:type III pantothenate kinase [Saprospiraceae bacterium]
MHLVIDIGNTRTKIGLFDGPRLARKTVGQHWSAETLRHWTHNAAIDGAIFSSVADDDQGLRQDLSDHFQAFELHHHTPLPFRNAYRTPETLGKDRLAAAAGALALFPGRHCLVIDCGTCIKYELIDAKAVYLGGNIAPGLLMRIQAMHHFTARLPEVPLEMPADNIGNSTSTALQNGALRGAIFEIEGFIRQFEQQFGQLTIILTGGDAEFVQQFLNRPDAILEPDLILYGLHNILTFNLTT